MAPAPRSLAVSTNPAIDRVARLAGPAAGVVPAAELLETPGGKAAHVAMVARALGAEVELLTTAGGRSGDLFLSLLGEEDFAVHPVAVAGETRGTYTLVVEGEADVVEVHEPAGEWGSGDADALVAALERLAPEFETVAICGSLPPGAPVDLHSRLVAVARAEGARTILDCSTVPAFEAALAAGPDLVAPNLSEARRLFAADPSAVREVPPPTGPKPDEGSEFRPIGSELLGLCDELLAAGAGSVWLSLGGDGSLLATAERAVRLRAPAPPPPVNAVGCGDALLGGLLAGLAERAGDDLVGAAALGVAAATDKLTHLHPGRVEAERVRALASAVEATPLRGEVAA
ncbi:MAG: PfkB family carbohydrate kinase [Solirubrobacterales bacterium]